MEVRRGLLQSPRTRRGLSNPARSQRHHFCTLASQARGHVSLVLSHRICGAQSQQPQETHSGHSRAPNNLPACWPQCGQGREGEESSGSMRAETLAGAKLTPVLRVPVAEGCGVWQLPSGGPALGLLDATCPRTPPADMR